MRLGKRLGMLTTIAAAAVALAPPVHADVDTDFANQLHGYGIYGPRDYNAWLAKITCERLGNGLDTNAEKSAQFLSHNLPRAPRPRRHGNSFPPQLIRTAPSRCRC
jgi:hypothetical protein